jgi:hypothetical protein
MFINDTFQVQAIAPGSTFSKTYNLHLPVTDPIDVGSYFFGKLKTQAFNGMGSEYQERWVTGTIIPPNVPGFALLPIVNPDIVFTTTVTFPAPGTLQFTLNFINADAVNILQIVYCNLSIEQFPIVF